MPRLTIVTFGYDVAPPPADCVWVADVRNIPASVVDGLWQLTGMDKAVQDKVLATDQAQAWVRDFTDDVMPELQDGDTIAIGCSIGVHRSVAVAQEIARVARDNGFDVTVKNRDLNSQRDTSSTIDDMSNFEIRAIGDVAFSVDGGKPRIDARAVVFDSWSEDLGGFRERMMPGSVTLSPDMVALFDHDTSMVLGRVSAGTMEVRSDSAGVAFTAYPPETTWANDLKVSMSRGDIKGCSFRMMVEEDNWYVQDGTVCRDILKAGLSELTITSMPAYPATTAEARSHAQALAVEIPADVEERAGRVISDSNEQLLKNAYAAIELAEDALETVLKQVDPTFVEDEGEMEDPAEDPQISEPGTDGASEPMARSVDGASTSKTSTAFAAGFGFITTKGS